MKDIAETIEAIIKDHLWQLLRDLKKLDRPRLRDLFCRKEVACFCAAGALSTKELSEDVRSTIQYLERRIINHECHKVESVYCRRDKDLIWLTAYVWI